MRKSKRDALSQRLVLKENRIKGREENSNTHEKRRRRLFPCHRTVNNL